MSESDQAGDRWSPSVLDALSQAGAPGARAANAQAAAIDEEAERRKGFDKGYAEGLAAGRAQAESIVGELRALLDAMAAPFEDTDAVLLRELLAITERVARAVVRRELEAGVDIEQVLADALAALGSVSVPVELRLNPEDAALCRDLGLVTDERFTVHESPGMQRGGLQLRAGHSFVDASVESRIEAALGALRADAGVPEELEDTPQAATVRESASPDLSSEEM
nr:FliH/SctL family protein [Congregibacter litoralis]